MGEKIHKKLLFFVKSLQIRQNSTNFLGGSPKKKKFFFSKEKNLPTQGSNLTRVHINSYETLFLDSISQKVCVYIIIKSSMAFRPLITRSPVKINKVRPILLLTTCDICKLKYFKKNLIVCQNCPILICQKCIKHCGNCGRFLCEKCDD